MNDYKGFRSDGLLTSLSSVSREEMAKLFVADLALVSGELMGVNPLAGCSAIGLIDRLRIERCALVLSGEPQGVGGYIDREDGDSVRNQASSSAEGLTLLP